MKAFAMSLNIIIHLSDLYFSGFIILLDGIMYIINHILSTVEFSPVRWFRARFQVR